jgi:hypothetical protein
VKRLQLKLKNRDILLLNASAMPLILQLTSAVSDERILDISRVTDSRQLKAQGWLVLLAAEGNEGIAFNGEAFNRLSRTGLRARINSVHNLKSLISKFEIERSSGLRLVDHFDCPSGWSSYRVDTSSGAILVAFSEGALRDEYLPLLAQFRERELRLVAAKRVRIRLSGEVEWNELISVGDLRCFSAINVRCLEQEIVAEIFISEGGCLAMQREELKAEFNQAGVRVAIDIGEVDLSLGELAGLRTGNRVELSAEMPLRCYMKVGATTIAICELEQVDDGLQIVVRELLG